MNSPDLRHFAPVHGMADSGSYSAMWKTLRNTKIDQTFSFLQIVQVFELLVIPFHPVIIVCCLIVFLSFPGSHLGYGFIALFV